MNKTLRLSIPVLLSILAFGASAPFAFAQTPPPVIVNEFSSASNTEWVELLNTTTDPIDLTGWTIQDLAHAPKSLSSLGTIPANGIVVFEHASGWLNDAPVTESITIFDGINAPIHSISYGSSPEANVTAPENGESALLGTDQTTWDVGVPTKGWFNDAGEEGSVPLLNTIDSALAFSAGIDSNIGELDNPSATPTAEADALYFEKAGEGKIVFAAKLNLSDQATVAALQSLGTSMEMSGGHIKFDSATADAMSVTGAKIYMYGLAEFDAEPDLVVKNDFGAVIPQDDVDNYPTIVKSWDNDTKTLSFTTSHFTQFDVPDPADTAAVGADKEALSDFMILGTNNPSLDNVSDNLTLPSSGSINLSTIIWESSNINVVSNEGTVTAPTFTDGDANVTLTATITKGLASDTKVFPITVLALPLPASTDTSITSGSYSITPNEGGGGDITGVPFGTLDVDFFGALIKGEPNQDWSQSTISNPVATGDMLRVYAEDDSTMGLYNITVDADPDIVLLAADAGALDLANFLGANADLDHIISAFDPLPMAGSIHESNITWTSSAPGWISDDGQSVTRSSFGSPDALVTITAHLLKGSQSDNKDFNVTVLAETTDPDIELLAADTEALSDLMILGTNPSLENVSDNLTLPSSGSINLSTITWESSNTNVVSNEGTVTAPAFTDGDANVTLTATITKNAQSDTKIFDVTVLRLPASADTVITSETYSITSNEDGSESINNVVYGTSKENFLSMLTMNEAHQTWDSSGITDPVASSNTLVVTAEDGTIATYTIGALLPSTPTNLQMTPASPTNNTQPTVSWDPVVAEPVVTYYEVEVYNDDDGISSTTPEVSYTVESPLSDYEYVWRVRACNADVCSNWSLEQSFTVDTTPPTVSYLGDGTSNYQLPSLSEGLFGATLIFSEKLSSTGRIAVQDALTAIADKSLTFRWNDNNDGDGTRMRMSVSGDETATFASAVTADGTDLAGNTAASLLLVDVDDTAPDVTKLGDDSTDVNLEVGDTNLSFSEALSDSSQTAVQNALAAGADKELTYYWNDGYILTITATETTTFANDVMATVSDVSDNTATLLLVDSKLADTQITPNSDTGIATIDSENNEVVITNPTQAVTLTIADDAVNPTIDVSSFISGGTGTLPQITITSTNANNANVAIPASTVVTSADATWNGIIAAPTVTTVTLPEISGETLTPSTAVEVGFTGAKLSFDKAVRLLLPEQAGKLAGYVRTGIAFTEITNTCSADNQTTGDALVVDGDCKIDVGSDLAIWTKHFTSFATYTQTTASSNRRAVTYSTPVAASVVPTPITSVTPTISEVPVTVSASTVPVTSATPVTSTQGKVLGATVYNFTKNLKVGSRSADVTALQQFLIGSGYSMPSGATGYFGRETKAAVKAFQKLRGIEQLGTVGPLTRAELNKGAIATTIETTSQTSSNSNLTASVSSSLTVTQMSAILSVLQSFGVDQTMMDKVRAALAK